MVITDFLRPGFYGRLCRNGKSPIPFPGLQQQWATMVHTVSHGNLHHCYPSSSPRDCNWTGVSWRIHHRLQQHQSSSKGCRSQSALYSICRWSLFRDKSVLDYDLLPKLLHESPSMDRSRSGNLHERCRRQCRSNCRSSRLR